MPIEIIKGDLLKSNCDVIAHQANCQGVMNSGIAKHIRQIMPWAWEALRDDAREPRAKLGTFSMKRNYMNLDLPYAVYNLYGQLHFGRFNVVYTDYDALRSALTLMIKDIEVREINMRRMAGGSPRAQLIWDRLVYGDWNEKWTIGLPYGIGCGLANGKWEIVQDIILTVADNHKRIIKLYQL